MSRIAASIKNAISKFQWKKKVGRDKVQVEEDTEHESGEIEHESGEDTGSESFVTI